MIMQLRASISYRTLYACVRCGRMEAGTTAEKNLSSVGELQEFLEAPPQRSHDMPVGWASHHGEGFCCPDCLKRAPEKEGTK
jgi:hypothetical protein